MTKTTVDRVVGVTPINWVGGHEITLNAIQAAVKKDPSLLVVLNEAFVQDLRGELANGVKQITIDNEQYRVRVGRINSVLEKYLTVLKNRGIELSPIQKMALSGLIFQCISNASAPVLGTKEVEGVDGLQAQWLREKEALIPKSGLIDPKNQRKVDEIDELLMSVLKYRSTVEDQFLKSTARPVTDRTIHRREATVMHY